MNFPKTATRLAIGTALALSIAGTSSLGMAQSDYPNQPIRLIVPFAAGGNADVVARLVAPGLSETLGQPVAVVNMPGAAGLVGLNHVANSDADGHTLIMVTSSYVTSAALDAGSVYDPRDALDPITLVSIAPTLVVAGPTVEAETLEALIADARERPGYYTYATYGDLSTPHLAGAYFADLVGIEIEPIPYGGAGPAVTAVVSGEVDLLLPSLAAAQSQVSAGQIRALSVAGSERHELLPDTPTFSELGIDFDMGTWFGLLAPRGTDPAINARLNEAMVELLTSDDIRERLERDGSVVLGYELEDFADFIAQETDVWLAVREGGLF